MQSQNKGTVGSRRSGPPGSTPESTAAVQPGRGRCALILDKTSPLSVLTLYGTVSVSN